MKISSWLLLVFHSILALLACLFVIVYNHVGVMLVRDDTLKALVESLLRLQSFAFLVPIAGFVAAFTMRKSEKPLFAFVFSHCLFLFAFAWPLIAILLWQVQRIKIIN